MDHSTLQKYFEGNCTEQEAEAVKQWLEQHPEEALRYMEAAWEEEPAQTMPAHMEQQLHASLPLLPVRRRIPVAAWWSAAAAVLLIAAGLWFMKHNAHTGTFNTAGMMAINTAGKHILPDGTEVWLKANASISIDTVAYGKNSRSIRLDAGEVFFDVKTNAQAPFEVISKNTITRVLGTSFSVVAGNDIKVAVATGKVSVQADGKNAVALTPGKSVSVHNNGETILTSVPAWLPGLWKENSLQLTDASFEELRLALQTFYGVHLRTASDHVKQQLYNIKIERTTPAANVIQVLGLLNGIEYEKQNDSTYLIN